jgi:hypothetical protein
MICYRQSLGRQLERHLEASEEEPRPIREKWAGESVGAGPCCCALCLVAPRRDRGPRRSCGRARKSDRGEGCFLERAEGGWLRDWHPRRMSAGEEEKERRRTCKNQSPGPSRRASRPPPKKVRMRLAGGGWRRRRRRQRTMSLCVVCVVCASCEPHRLELELLSSAHCHHSIQHARDGSVLCARLLQAQLGRVQAPLAVW